MNEIRINDGVVFIHLKGGLHCLIDETDLPIVSDRIWHLQICGRLRYAVSKGLLMHRRLTDAPDDRVVDHKNRNGLDNRRCNLRLADDRLNGANKGKFGGTSRYKGVSWHSQTRRWRALISVNGTSVYLGAFDNQRTAALAYDRAALKQFGEFALTNKKLGLLETDWRAIIRIRGGLMPNVAA